METKFTEQESLAVINEMINRARGNVQKGSANALIYNGYAVAFVSILNFVLLNLLPDSKLNWAFWVWMLMAPSGFVSRYIQNKVDHSSIVKTQIDGIISALWRGFAVSVLVLLGILFLLASIYHSWHYFAVITPTIMIMSALAEFGMAKACAFRPFFWGAVIFWIGAILCCVVSFIVFRRSDLQFLILAACMITGFVIPGRQLNKLAKDHV